MVDGIASCRFRAMREDDLERVAEIESQGGAYAWSRRKFSDSLAAGDQGLVCHAAGDVGEIRAFAVVSQVLDEASLLNLRVDTAWQGRGVGKEMLAFVLDRLRAMGVRKVFLEVRASNHRAVRLYESQGFHFISRRKGYYPAPGGREDALIFVYLIFRRSVFGPGGPRP